MPRGNRVKNWQGISKSPVYLATVSFGNRHGKQLLELRKYVQIKGLYPKKGIGRLNSIVYI